MLESFSFPETVFNVLDQPYETVLKFVTDLCRKGYYPGAAIAIGSSAEINILRGIGSLEPSAESPAVTPQTLFDLASLTKPVATTTTILQLIDAGSLTLNHAAASFLPELDTEGKAEITIQQLLTHTAGFPAWKPLYLEGSTTAKLIQAIAGTPLESTPGTRVTYSCLGFILLGEIIRRIVGTSLDEYTKTHIFLSLNMLNTGFNPHQSRSCISPTEKGNQFERTLAGPHAAQYPFRTHRLWGEVHDGNAHAAAGEGGNAGLFSTAEDLSKFARMILNSGKFNGKQVLQDWLVKISTQNQTPHLNLFRGLGWQMAETSLSAGSRMSREAFGHNGFTGTSLWIDPTYDLFIIFLTNRAYHGGNGNLFAAARAPFHDLVMNCYFAARPSSTE